MAKTEVGLSVDVEFQSIGQMRKAIKEATGDLIAMSEKFGTSSKEATAAAKRVAELKDRLGDAKALADTFNPDKKFVALGGAIQGATAGFSALQGAMGLFGSESKDLEKMLLKVQSAMALQQGISGIAGAMDSMKMLAGTIKTQVVTAFSTLRGAIIATGLGALAVAVGVVITNFDSFKKAVFNLIPGLKGVTDFIGSLVTKFTDFIGITSEAERNIEKIKKANGRANETIDAQIKLLEAQGGKEEEIYKLKKDRVENELNILRTTLKEKGKLTDEEQKQFRELNTQKKIIDIDESNRKNKLAQDDAKKQKELNDAANKIRQDAEKSYTEFLKNEKDNQSKIGLSDRDKELKELQLKYDQQIAIAKKYGFDTSELLRLQKEQEAAINTKYDKQIQDNTEKSITDNAKRTKELQDQLRLSAITDQKEREKVDRELQLQSELDAETERYKNGEVRLEQYLFNLALIRQKYANDEKLRLETDAKDKAKIEEDFNKQRIDAEIAVQNATFDAASAGLNAMQMLAGENKKLANAFFVIDKALAIVKIIVDTQREIASYYAAGAASPTNILAPGSGTIIATQQAIAAKIRAGISIATIAATTIGKFTSGGGGGGANVPSPAAPPPIAATLPPTATAQLVNAQAINNLGNQATRAYVLNSDIQNNDQRNAYLQRNARLG